MKKTVAGVYGYGLPSSSGRVGEQTRGRLDKAIDLYRKGVVSEIWIAVGGEPIRGTYKHESMKRYLKAQGVERIVVRPRAETTLEETQKFYHLQTESKKAAGERVRVIAVSSWYHIPRIKMEWFMRYNQIVEAASNRRATRIRDILLEPAKYAYTYFKLLWEKTTVYVRNWKLA